MLGGKASPISTLKYIYSSDGMIAGRVVDGKFQMYSYDKRGQLLRVAEEAMEAAVAMPYNGRNHNCLDITKAGLSAAGIEFDDSDWRPSHAGMMRSNASNLTSMLKQIQE